MPTLFHLIFPIGSKNIPGPVVVYFITLKICRRGNSIKFKMQMDHRDCQAKLFQLSLRIAPCNARIIVAFPSLSIAYSLSEKSVSLILSYINASKFKFLTLLGEI